MKFLGLSLSSGAVALLLTVSTSAQTAAPVIAPPYTARAAIVDPDQGKMGTYRSLAQLAYEACVENHATRAVVLARILEKVWDRSEIGLRKSSPEVWSRIDKSMDAFIKPILSQGAQEGGSPNSPMLTKVYQQYLRDLDAAD